ncbi:1-deoxy-D-xylulose-5-phosphate reductoisomerase [Gammaproteobacteria bacterium]|nr:1-deoxy-D-xylulose-5-phosphate reductoisomerase [Gammaproteobacteria bacterium]MDA8925134.1 1-deoxy-D-xylulose-5-phosphate reductoisomerase [Gammaproteobacteria bacterium]MDA9049204.1 1-deoxy-D-xylulose-5-phosphate reductoisomerase [Gammaproteobacteria bacterium]MDA9341196.1 1-deoxy-D-xylulose-5-phosphate reductoisomerase [Gammaproteobacteria bacterium]MDB9791016.1 1-deoxy-D-xylulose-5-phosphate reductoisomerase [Gammaproteobacteria bacterium]|tara:strand:+ start:3780 stop:4931 length:1152 start_codon:yes stop_codon:yes gene_type:complete
MKNIVLLGATGSIGTSTLNVLRQNKGKFNLQSIALDQDLDAAQKIDNEFHPESIFIASDKVSLHHPLLQSHAKIYSDQVALKELIQHPEVDIVISAISGFAGLQGSFYAIDAGKTTLVANKESIVAAGDILLPLARQRSAKIIPVDSEHNAIYQCLSGEQDTSAISKILITASGGPFRDMSMTELEGVTLEDALRHPTWVMGSKITIDSATLMNKCLELIEACYLFDVPESAIEIATHPQSIIHSMVTYHDGSTIAQMSNPSMEVPIANALGEGNRLPIQFTDLDFSSMNLTFGPIPEGREMIFEMAREVCRKKGNLGAIFNAANEVAVKAFQEKQITFLNIYEVVSRTFHHFTGSNISTMEDVFEYDQQARIQAEKVIKSLN